MTADRELGAGAAGRAGQPDGEPLRALPLHPLEAATGLALGFEEPATFTIRPAEPEPLEALIAVIADVLARGPTYVSFSGGRDSSAVLAAAAVAARRHGLPDPIPVTQRFAGVPSTEEKRWQELVIDHLALTRWEIIEIGDELDLLGDIAQQVLLTHGLLWPPNTYFHVPMLERAREASLMTGFDGDGVFGAWRWARAQSVLHGRVRPVARDAGRVALALAPVSIRRGLMARPLVARAAPWLRPQAQAWLERQARANDAAEPLRWDRRLAFYGRARFLRLGAHSLQALGCAHRVAIVNPILDGRFVSALASAGGAAGLGDRIALMRNVFAGILPAQAVARRGKAEFGHALWLSRARAFADSWDGSGVDLELVDAERLRDAWNADNPLFGASTLLQTAWLSGQARRQGGTPTRADSA